MKLTEEQKNQILNQYEGLKNDEQTLEELHEIIVDFCVDNEIVDLSEDEDGDMFEEFSNNVWDYLETIM
jgi:cobalamin biosynthesis Mg chelatase CobN